MLVQLADLKRTDVTNKHRIPDATLFHGLGNSINDYASTGSRTQHGLTALLVDKRP